MKIKSMEVHNYRNYEKAFIELSDKTNILFGKNAQGKTNILEAAYISATTRSHKGSKDKDIIKFGSDESHIKTRIEKNQQEYDIDIHLRKNKTKGIAINKVPVKKAAELLGILRVVLFSPEDLNVIKNGPLERRKFLDMELCQIDKIYMSDLTKYNKILNQRNKVLKSIVYEPELIETLDIWTKQLISYGKRIIEKRESFLNDLKPIIKKNYENIARNTETLDIFYEPNVSIEDYEENVELSKKNDERYAQTHVGPHRDDIRFEINGVDARYFASQGQQRSCALALKLSEIEIMEKKTGEKPVLLLDDVLSELDKDRQEDLLKSLYDVQTLITCTDMEEMVSNKIEYQRLFHVHNATIDCVK